MGVLLKPDNIDYMPLPFIVIIDVFKLKTSLPADEFWTSLTDQLKIGKDKFV